MITKRYKTEIDWEMAIKYCEETFPKLKFEMERNLPKLEGIKPSIYLIQTPPSIQFKYIFEVDGANVLEGGSSQLKNNLESIAEIVGQIAHEFSFRVFQLRDDYNDNGFICYYLKPHYQRDFQKKQK